MTLWRKLLGGRSQVASNWLIYKPNECSSSWISNAGLTDSPGALCLRVLIALSLPILLRCPFLHGKLLSPSSSAYDNPLKPKVTLQSHWSQFSEVLGWPPVVQTWLLALMPSFERAVIRPAFKPGEKPIVLFSSRCPDLSFWSQENCFHFHEIRAKGCCEHCKC